MKTSSDGTHITPERSGNFDPGALLVDSFLTEEQEQQVLDEIAQELQEGSEPTAPRQPRSHTRTPSSDRATISLALLRQITQRGRLMESVRELSEASAAVPKQLLCFNGFIT